MLAAPLISGPYRVPKLAWRATQLYTNTCGKAAYRGPWMMETTAREQFDRRRRPRDRRRPARAAAPQRAPPHRAALHLAGRPAHRPRVARGDARAGRRRDRLRRVPRRAAGRGAATAASSASASPSTWSRRPTVGPYNNEPVHIRIATRRPGRRVPRVGRPRPGARDHHRTAHRRVPRRARRRRLRAPGRHRVDAVRRGHRRQPQRPHDRCGRARARRRCCKEKVFAIAGHLLEAAPEDLEIAERVISVKGTPAKQVTLAQVAQTAYQGSSTLPPEIDPVLEVVHRYAAPPGMWSNACARLHRGGRPRHGHGRDPPLRRGRGLRADDQPEHRRGPDRRRRRAGHRRGALRAQRVRRGRQPAGVDVPRLPAADGRRDPRRRVPPHGDAGRRPPAASRAWARAAPSALPPAVFNAVADALAQVGATITDQPAGPDQVLAALRAASR